jgi:caspase-like apoptosis-related cysteine protease
MPYFEIVFVFRGDASDFGVRLTSGRIQRDGSASVILPTMSDILIGYSTLPGFISNRDVYLGTWYIQAICEVFMEHAWDTDIEDMLKMVSLLTLFYSFTKLIADCNTLKIGDT